MSANGKDATVIVGAARTAIGGFQGSLAPLSAPQLGGEAIQAALARRASVRADVSEVLMGCVLPAGQGQAPARQAALGAGLPQSVPCSTVNKMCGSGMKTVMMAHDALPRRPAEHHRGRWHGEHVECALSAAQGARRHCGSAMARCSTTCSSTGWRTPMTRAA